ncbi:MAG: flippase activity-associated protein Agl23, partial [Halobacteriaceae archaeon]
MRQYLRRLSRRPVLAGVLIVTIVALAARFAGLGFRMMHWDEGRVGYRILQYAASGEWSYNPYVHGPFLFHVNKYIFQMFGATDFIARFVVALVGGLLPLSALLLRKRLKPAGTVGLALVLAVNPILLYYSRFMRNDVLVAGFSLIAFGAFVYAIDERDPLYVHGGIIALALAFTTKENAVKYVGIWIGALALTIDHRLFRRREAWPIVKRGGRKILDQAWEWRRHLAIAVLEFFVIIVYFYAPRPDLWIAFSNPSHFPGVIETATLGSWEKFMNSWGSGAHQKHPYLPFLKDYIKTLRAGAMATIMLGVGGFVYDRYTGEGHEPIVEFAGYWAGASFLLYPLAS